MLDKAKPKNKGKENTDLSPDLKEDESKPLLLPLHRQVLSIERIFNYIKENFGKTESIKVMLLILDRLHS